MTKIEDSDKPSGAMVNSISLGISGYISSSLARLSAALYSEREMSFLFFGDSPK